eukprot:GEMP01023410.1.p1 GENE.GEMP01023410.1~~GEMP01023410.1.p1  ORF type:complete len:141 (+),score=40.83 GEMP01023410.1:513-935(+)
MLEKSLELRMSQWGELQETVLTDLRNGHDEENEIENKIVMLEQKTRHFITNDLTEARRKHDTAKTMVKERQEKKAEIIRQLQQVQELHAQSLEKCQASKTKYIDKKREYDDMVARWRIGHVDSHTKRITRRNELDRNVAV